MHQPTQNRQTSKKIALGRRIQWQILLLALPNETRLYSDPSNGALTQKNLPPDLDFDIIAHDFHDLADQLGCYQHLVRI